MIAEAIKQADTSYFFEDYSRQAQAVLKTLKSQGYTLVPCEPTEEMITAGVNAIGSGKIRPSDHVRYVYGDMIREGARSNSVA